MDLKIKDVAELLNVSETTIRRWLTSGRIPAYKINHQYRFSRIEIENWMMSCKVKSHRKGPFPFSEEQIYPPKEEREENSGKGGQQQYSLYRALHLGDVYDDIDGSEKVEMIQKSMQRIAPKLGLDSGVLTDLLLDRENLMPTALNNGVAVPHARDFVLPTPGDCITVVFPKNPIEYGALDGNFVHTLFFLFSSSDKRHLHLLSKIAHFCSQADTLAFLQTRPNKELLLDFVKCWEAKVSG